MMEWANLTLVVSNRILVKNLTGGIRPGECWCILGPNGVGKSTLLRALAGIQPPNQGEISWQGRSIKQLSLSEWACIRSFLPQKSNDIQGYRVRDLILAARYPYRSKHYWESTEDIYCAESALQTMGVFDLMNQPLGTLSGGERQRVAIAALLTQDTELLLLDEPTAGLDLVHQMNTLSVLSNLYRSQKKSLLMVSHDINWVRHIATHVILLLGAGQWLSGSVFDMMRPDLLSQCMGYSIEQIQHAGGTFFYPRLKEPSINTPYPPQNVTVPMPLSKKSNAHEF